MSTRIQKPKAKTPNNSPRNRTALFATAALVLVGVAFAIWAGGKALVPETGTPPAQQASESQQQTPQTQSDPTAAEPEKKMFSETMLSAEQPQEEPEEPAMAEDPDMPFKLEQVASGLSHVQLDEDGNVVVNEAVQVVLEQAFFNARANVNEAQLEDLKAMIEAGLGGQAGQQAVEITEKFYRYSNAYREISDTLAVRTNPTSLRNDYEQIARLRRTHLGPELADQLYGREEQLTRYTLSVMEIQADPELTPEQRKTKQRELAAQYPDVMPDNSADEDEQIPN